jgi:dihydrolipoamide dehydrogenase
VSEVEVRVPDIGDFTDVPVVEILVNAGDTVAVEDPLVALESDKATMEVPSPVAGTIKQLRVAVDDRVSEGSVILTLESEDAPNDSQAGDSPSSSAEDQSAQQPKAAETDAKSGSGDDASAAAADSKPAAPAAAAPMPSFDPNNDCQLLVIGSGPGGYTAAFRAADLGLKVILVERYETLGGVCLNVGCIPSKALLHAAKVISEASDLGEHGIKFAAPKVDLKKLIEFKDGVVTKLTGGLGGMAKQRKVEVVTGEAQFTGKNSVKVGDREISFDNCIIAAGSEPVKLPFIPDDPRVIDSTGALSPEELPKRLLVLGGGIIGLEMATVYDALGTKVTVVEMMDQLIPGCDPDLVRPLRKRIESRYEAVLTGVQVTAVKAQKNGLKVSFSEGKDQLFDRVLVAVGRVPNGNKLGAEAAGVKVSDRGFIEVDDQQRTNVPNIYAIGDIVGQPMLAHKATHEAKVAAEVIAGENVVFDALTIPSVAYTDPEVAWMGLTETKAKADGVKYEKAVFPWVASGRALGIDRPEGSTKLLFEPDSGRLLGAGIVGIGAGDLISETVLALEMGATAEDIALTVHPHPTLSESVAFAAEIQDGSITDLMPPRKRK